MIMVPHYLGDGFNVCDCVETSIMPRIFLVDVLRLIKLSFACAFGFLLCFFFFLKKKNDLKGIGFLH